MPELEDNIYRSSTEHFMSPPAAQVEEHDAEKDQILSNAPQIRDAIKSLRKKATFYESVNSIDDSVLTNPEEFMHVVAANKLTAQALREEANKLDGVLKEYSED